jgi:hypothetical protein
MDRRIERRQFLTVAGAGLGSLAGCVGGTGETSTGTSAETVTRTQTTSTRSATTERETTETQTTTRRDPMSTVFHFTKTGAQNQRHALANVANLLTDETTPTDEVVLVANGGGVKLLTVEECAYPDRVATLLETGASFRACENSMRAQSLTEDDLIDGAETVPAGVGELTKLQADGFAYIETP